MFDAAEELPVEGSKGSVSLLKGWAVAESLTFFVLVLLLPLSPHSSYLSFSLSYLILMLLP